LLQDKFEQIFEEDVVRTSGGEKRAKNSGANSVDSGSGRKPFFINKKIKYVWDSGLMMFTKLRHLDNDMRQGDFHR
jgi:hypothetical protein